MGMGGLGCTRACGETADGALGAIDGAGWWDCSLASKGCEADVDAILVPSASLLLSRPRSEMSGRRQSGLLSVLAAGTPAWR